jgi:hypothetical protein
LEVKDANYIKKYDNNLFEAIFSKGILKSNCFKYENKYGNTS